MHLHVLEHKLYVVPSLPPIPVTRAFSCCIINLTGKLIKNLICLNFLKDNVKVPCFGKFCEIIGAGNKVQYPFHVKAIKKTLKGKPLIFKDKKVGTVQYFKS